MDIEALHVQLRRPETGPSWEGVLRPEPLNYVTLFNPSWQGRRENACMVRLRSRLHDAGPTLNDVLGLGPTRGCPPNFRTPKSLMAKRTVLARRLRIWGVEFPSQGLIDISMGPSAQVIDGYRGMVSRPSATLALLSLQSDVGGYRLVFRTCPAWLMGPAICQRLSRNAGAPHPLHVHQVTVRHRKHRGRDGHLRICEAIYLYAPSRPL